MTGFIIAAALLTLAVLALLLTPLLRRKPHSSASQRQLNAAIYRDQLNELEGDFKDGGLSEADYNHDREELQRRLLEDAAEAELPAAAPSGGNKRTVIVLAVLLPAIAAGLYALLGTPEALNPTAAAQHNAGSAELELMVAKLAARQEKNPDDLNGWVMLGRSYKAFGRFDEALKALDRAMPLIEKDANLLAIYADALAAKTGSLEGKPRQFIEQALTLDPNSTMALDLAGTAAYNRKDFAAAAGYWERQLKLMPPDSDYAKSLSAGIAEARAQAGSAGIDDIAAPRGKK
jgi:cytochrome c-type biogenesis protein CcmH